jgi:hypothetical protein
MWKELNFVTAHKVKSLANTHGLRVSFDRGVLGRTLRRYNQDDVFRQRQGRLVAVVQRVLANTGLARALDQLPGELVTPMVTRFIRRHEIPAHGSELGT